MLELSIVIPTYNEKDNIGILIPAIAEALSGITYEIVVVDDSSPDGTGIIVQNMASTGYPVRLITKRKKEGIGAALRVGYEACHSRLIASTDADLSFDPLDLKRLYEAAQSGLDFIVGTRHSHGSFYETPTFTIWVKHIVSLIGNRVLRSITGIPLDDFTGNFRIFKRQVWKTIHTQETTNSLLFEMILKTYVQGHAIGQIPVAFHDRRYGASKLRLSFEVSKYFRKLLRYLWQYRFELVHRSRRHYWQKLAYIGVMGTYCYLQIGVLNANTIMQRGLDEAGYVETAEASLYSSSFWGGPRPPTLPALIKIVQFDPNLLGNVQLLISIVSWTILALVITLFVRNRLIRLIAFATILGYSLTNQISIWNHLYMSDSLSLSLSALLVAAGLLYIHRPTWPKYGLLIGIAIPFGFIRDINTYFLLLLAIVALIAANWVQHRHRLQLWLMAIIFSLIFILGSLSASHESRWTFPFIDVVYQRILVNESMQQWFIDHGMPINEAVRNKRGAIAEPSSASRGFPIDPQFNSFRQWVFTNGRITYIKYIITHPIYLLIGPKVEMRDMLMADYLSYAPRGYRPINSNATWEKFTQGKILILHAILFILLLYMSFLYCWQRQRSVLWIFSVSLLILLYPFLLIIWHGDTVTITRHGLGAAVFFQLAVLCILLTLIDGLYFNNYPGSSTTPEGSNGIIDIL